MRRTTKRPRWLAILATAILATPAGSVVSTPAAHAAGTRPFSLTITHVSCVDDCDDEGLEALSTDLPTCTRRSGSTG